MSAVENEVTRETVEFTHDGRTWHAPAKIRLSHMRKFRDGYRMSGNADLAMVEAYLPADDLAALYELDPTDDELDKFTDALAAAMGFKTQGNS